MSASWFPGHMAKGLRQMEEYMPYVDVLIETVDARIPASGRSSELASFQERRPSMIVLNKRDLADPVLLDRWLDVYNKAGLPGIAVDAQNRRDIERMEDLAFELGQEKLDKAEAKGRGGRPLRVLVLGVPNSGKSTLINRMSGRKARPAENRAGVTRAVSWVRSPHKGIELLDSPGVLWPDANNPEVLRKLAACSALPDNVIDRETVAYQTFLMMAEHYPEVLEETYGLEGPWTLDPSLDYPLYEQGALARGCVMSGGRPNLSRFADLFMRDLRTGKLGGVCWDREPHSL